MIGSRFRWGVAAACLALASCDDPYAEPPTHAATGELVGGAECAPCAWPNVGWLPGRCTATLVHPRLILYAGHCQADIDAVEIGGRSVGVARCDVHPDGGPGNGLDFAYCVLAEEVTDVPIVPIVAGCETSVIREGQPVTLVGFGSSGQEGSIGVRRAWTSTIRAVDVELRVGGDGLSICEGDSGGPAFAALDDGTWRLVGIASSTNSNACDGQRVVRLGPATNLLPWLETSSGVDVTPCFDEGGEWRPTAACGGFPVAPYAPPPPPSDEGGLCPPSFVGERSATCGPPYEPPAESGCAVAGIRRHEAVEAGPARRSWTSLFLGCGIALAPLTRRARRSRRAAAGRL